MLCTVPCNGSQLSTEPGTSITNRCLSSLALMFKLERKRPLLCSLHHAPVKWNVPTLTWFLTVKALVLIQAQNAPGFQSCATLPFMDKLAQIAG